MLFELFLPACPYQNCASVIWAPGLGSTAFVLPPSWAPYAGTPLTAMAIIPLVGGSVLEDTIIGFKGIYKNKDYPKQ